MTPIELAWFAGIVDGEGCITCNIQKPGTGGRKNHSYRLYLKVTMGHKPTILRLHELAGVGAITKQPSKKHNDAWTWWVATEQALLLLETLRPHLITKAEEADIALSWRDIPDGRKWRETPPDVLAARHRLFERLRDIKPSARFRKVKTTSKQ